MKDSFASFHYIVNQYGYIYPDFPIKQEEIMEVAHNLESWDDKVVVFKVTLMFDPLDTSKDVARICERKEIYRTEGFKLQEEK